MKYLKIFEDFSNENTRAITVVVSEGFKNKMRDLRGEVTTTDPFVLVNPTIKGGYNLVKIGSVKKPGSKNPEEVFEIGYWISYHPKTNEIVITESHSTWEDFLALEGGPLKTMPSEFSNNKEKIVITSDDFQQKFTIPIPPGYEHLKTDASGATKQFKDLFRAGEYSKFSKIEEGQSDQRNYVKIVSTSEENQPYRLD